MNKHTEATIILIMLFLAGVGLGVILGFLIGASRVDKSTPAVTVAEVIND